jgi:cytochrome c oxidase assembly protein subunit 15
MMQNGKWVTKPNAQLWVSRWMWLLAALVMILIVIGGLTRLTGSGLSIVEWQPVAGVLPPLSDSAWEAEFAKYQSHSEFQERNAWMELSDFKWIYTLEYIHRIWARLIGLVLMIPFAVFMIKRWLTLKTCLAIGGIFLLGGMQGAMGWIMVKSGLGNDPHVSPIKLTLHLILAVIILWQMIMLGLRIRLNKRILLDRFSSWTFLVMAIGLTFIYGGLVAGHKAGLIYNSYPLMGGQFIPDEVASLSPFWMDWFWNPVTVQFIHRWLATALVFWMIGLMALKAYQPSDRKWVLILSHAVLMQAVLGIATLLMHVPIGLAALHQGWGVLTLVLALTSLYRSSLVDSK